MGEPSSRPPENGDERISPNLALRRHAPSGGTRSTHEGTRSTREVVRCGVCVQRMIMFARSLRSACDERGTRRLHTRCRRLGSGMRTHGQHMDAAGRGGGGGCAMHSWCVAAPVWLLDEDHHSWRQPAAHWRQHDAVACAWHNSAGGLAARSSDTPRSIPCTARAKRRQVSPQPAHCPA